MHNNIDVVYIIFKYGPVCVLARDVDSLNSCPFDMCDVHVGVIDPCDNNNMHCSWGVYMYISIRVDL